MNYAYIVFWDENEPVVKLTPEEHKKIFVNWEKLEHIKLPTGRIINKKAVKDIKPPEKPEPLRIAQKIEGKPITKEKLDELKLKFSKLFTP